MNPSSGETAHPRPGRTGSGQRAAKAREAGLEMIRRVNRWLIAGAVAAAGLFSLLAAHTFHEHTVGASASSNSSAVSPSAPSSGAPQSSSSSAGSGLQAPAQAPSPAPAAPAPVVSGGS